MNVYYLLLSPRYPRSYTLLRSAARDDRSRHKSHANARQPAITTEASLSPWISYQCETPLMRRFSIRILNRIERL